MVIPYQYGNTIPPDLTRHVTHSANDQTGGGNIFHIEIISISIHASMISAVLPYQSYGAAHNINLHPKWLVKSPEFKSSWRILPPICISPISISHSSRAKAVEVKVKAVEVKVKAVEVTVKVKAVEVKVKAGSKSSWMILPPIYISAISISHSR